MTSKTTYIQGVKCPNPEYVKELEEKVYKLEVENMELSMSEESAQQYAKKCKEELEKSPPKRTPWYS